MADPDTAENVDRGQGYTVSNVGPYAGKKRYKGNPDRAPSITGNNSEDSQLSEIGANDATTPSNAGQQAQSTDHMNQY